MSQADLCAWAEAMGATVGRARAVRSSYGGRTASVSLELVDEGPGAPFAWVGCDGDCLFRAGPSTLARASMRSRGGRLFVHRVWERDLAADLGRIEHVTAGAADGRLATVGGAPGSALVVDTGSGEPLYRLPLTRASGWRPGHRTVAGNRGPLTGYGYADGVYVVELDGRTAWLPAPDGVGRPAFSPDGALLAAGAPGSVLLWAAPDWGRRQPLAADLGGPLDAVAWSPDGRYLAAAPAGRETGPVLVWHTGSWTVCQELGPASGANGAPVLAWSPDSTALAFPDRDGVPVVWDVPRGERLIEAPAPVGGDGVTGLVWSPDGDALAVGDGAGTLSVYAIPPASELAVNAPPGPLPYPVVMVARLGAAAAGVGSALPLSSLVDLLGLIEGRPVAGLAGVEDCRGAVALRGLRWPASAYLGVVVLVATHLRGEARFRPPAGLDRDDLERALCRILTGHGAAGGTGGSGHGTADAMELAGVLDRVADNYLGLLTVLGPRAVAAEPTLPARLRGLPRLPPLSAAHQRLLSVRLDGAGAEPQPAGPGTGGHRATGTGPRAMNLLQPGRKTTRHSLAAGRREIEAGPQNRPVARQLALPAAAPRARRGPDGSVCRAAGPPVRDGRPMIILLDDTPAVHGRVGVTLRLAAHLLAAEQIRQRSGCALVLLGTPDPVHYLVEPLHLMAIWTAGTLGRAHPERAARAAAALAPRMRERYDGPPRTVLLSHPYLRLPVPSDAMQLRVHYPDQPVKGGAGNTMVLPPDPDPAVLRRALVRVLTAPVAQVSRRW